jgi:hypothetical protein
MDHVKSVQDYLSGQKGTRDKNTMAVLVHGDAGFATIKLVLPQHLPKQKLVYIVLALQRPYKHPSSM